jgi:glucokinase
MPVPTVAAVDLGGTNTRVGLVSAEGEIVARTRLSTDATPAAQDLVIAIAGAIAALRAESGAEVVAAGVGAPNGNHRRGTVEHPPNLPWPGITPFADLLAGAAGVPAVLDNDANAAALGESRFGAGLGSGIVTGGALVRGHSGFAGELGHVIVEPGGRPCGCGRQGCLEQYASATGLARTYRELAPDAPDDVEAHGVFERARRGEAAAQAAFKQMGATLGRALANSVAYTSPEAIFLFGGVTAAGETLLEPVRRHLNANLLNVYRGTVRVDRSGLPGDDAALLGAASLAWQRVA